MKQIYKDNEDVKSISYLKISLKCNHPQAVVQLPTRGGTQPSSATGNLEFTNAALTSKGPKYGTTSQAGVNTWDETFPTLKPTLLQNSKTKQNSRGEATTLTTGSWENNTLAD